MKFRIAIFASGSGTNAINLIQYFKNHEKIEVEGIYCNKPNAGIVEKAQDINVKIRVFNRDEFNDGGLNRILLENQVDYIVLAGFLWLIPTHMITCYPNRIVNIHPALLPSYGGKGMYGSRVHEAVIEASEKVSGITIHLVDANYDSGEFLFQAETEILKDDTPDSLAGRIHRLEHENFPKVVEDLILKGSKY